jgi:ribosomal protein S18 acetylase RimI-like enzyme
VTSLDARAHANFTGWTQFLCRLEGGELFEQPGIIGFRGPTDFPSSRIALRTDPPATADAYVQALDEQLFAHGKTACTWARIDVDDDLNTALLDRGFQEFAQTPEMVCEHVLEDREPPAGVTVRLAATAADVRDYARIAGEAFSHLALPAEITAGTIDHPDVMLGSDVVIALADLDGEPVAGACVVMVGDRPEGYVGWVSCVDKARGHGLGDTVTRRVTNEAFARGADIVSLEASQFGEHTYARMGYRELYRYRLLIKL